MKKIFFIFVGLLLLAAIPITVFISGQRQELRKRAAPATNLSFSPSTLTKKIGDVFTLDITINTASNQIVAAEIHVTYDPTKLEAETITNGPLFPNILAAGTIQSGEATITVGALSTTSPVTGTGTVAVVRFKALATTASPISVRFSPATFVGGLGEGANNVLINSSPATISITSSNQQPGNPTSTPVPTLRPSGTISPTPNNPTPTSNPLTPTPTTTPGTLTITSPLTDDVIMTELPTFTGAAPPNSPVTITIYSPPETITTTANSLGRWSYTPTTPLTIGPHSLTVTIDSTNPQTTSRTFIVGSAAQSSGTQSAIPESGNITTTIIIIGISLFLLTTGLGTQLLLR